MLLLLLLRGSVARSFARCMHVLLALSSAPALERRACRDCGSAKGSARDGGAREQPARKQRAAFKCFGRSARLAHACMRGRTSAPRTKGSPSWRRQVARLGFIWASRGPRDAHRAPSKPARTPTGLTQAAHSLAVCARSLAGGADSSNSSSQPAGSQPRQPTRQPRRSRSRRRLAAGWLAGWQTGGAAAAQSHAQARLTNATPPPSPTMALAR